MCLVRKYTQLKTKIIKLLTRRLIYFQTLFKVYILKCSASNTEKQNIKVQLNVFLKYPIHKNFIGPLGTYDALTLLIKIVLQTSTIVFSLK